MNKNITRTAALGLLGSSLLLAGCGGSSGTVATYDNRIGTPSTYIDGESVALSAESVVALSRLQIGNTFGYFWDALSYASQETMIADTGFSRSTFESLRYEVLDSSIINDAWNDGISEVIAESSSSPYPISSSQVNVSILQDFVSDTISSKAPDAWLEGWTGEGITMSTSDSNVDTWGFKKAAMIAPGATLEAPGANTDIVLNNSSVTFQRYESYTKDYWSIGNSTAAGIGGLVMHKFPDATDTSVSSQVDYSSGNALLALTPQGNLE
jgi:hypothetical protein